MHGLARKLAGSIEAEDLAQDVFSLAFKSLHALRDESAFRAWVCGITARLARRQRRRRTVRQLLIEERGPTVGRHWDDIALAEARLELKEVSKRIARFRARERQVIFLHRLEGRTRAETAQAMGVSLSSVKRWIAQADQRLDSYRQGNVGSMAKKSA